MFACLIHATSTCASERPAVVRFVFTPSQSGWAGDSHESAAWPLRAPLTRTSVAWFTAGSAVACPTNDHVVHGAGLPVAQNSCVVFDMPTEIMAIFPLGDGAPLRSSGRTSAAWPRPTAAWSVGGFVAPCS